MKNLNQLVISNKKEMNDKKRIFLEKAKDYEISTLILKAHSENDMQCDSDLRVIILEGELLVKIYDKHLRLETGDTLLVRERVDRIFYNLKDKSAKLLIYSAKF